MHPGKGAEPSSSRLKSLFKIASRFHADHKTLAACLAEGTVNWMIECDPLAADNY